MLCVYHALPWWLSGKEPATVWGAAGDPDSLPGLGRSPRKRNGNSLQYSCLENSMDRGAWWATVHGVAELDTIEQLTQLQRTHLSMQET